jgi:DNA polymerase III subunit gamma/tau
LGLSDRTLLFESLKSIVHRDAQGVLTSLENISRSGFEPKNLAQDLLETIRNMLIIKVSGSEMTEILELPDSELKALAELSVNTTQEDLHFLFDMALKGAADISRSQDPRLVLEMLFLRMASAPEIVELKSIVQQSAVPGRSPDRLKEGAPSVKPAPEAPKKKFEIPDVVKPAPAAEKKQFEPAPKAVEPNEKWLQFVEKIREKEALFAAKIENLIFNKIENKVIFLGAPAFLRDQMKDPETRKKLKAFIDSYWGPGYSLEVLVGRETPQGETAQTLAQKKKELKDDEIKSMTAEHPKVKAAQMIFKGKIKSVSPTKKENL